MPRHDTNLLVLDVDETLVHGRDTNAPPPPRIDFWTCGCYPVMKRPFQDVFLRQVFASSLWRTAIWSTSSDDHVWGVLNTLLLPSELSNLEFVFTNKRCSRELLDPEEWEPNGERFVEVKDFKKLRRRGYDLNRVLVLDDTPRAHVRNYGNLVPIRPFTGDLEDRELLRVLPFLERWFSDPRGVRDIDKRGW